MESLRKISLEASSSCFIPSTTTDEQVHIDDNCSSSSGSTDDAFSYFSNNEIRLKTLKLQEVDHDVLATTTRTSRQYERKTRLSFELDPQLILEDELEEIFGNDDEADEDFFELDFSHLNKNGQSNTSKLNLLAELLQM